jgi:serine/threonine protein phosphatase 1
MSRTLVIGDIHGGLRAVYQIMERANVTKKDTLIFLGDYVDGWSESPQVLDYLMALGKTQKCIFIRGNHDQLLRFWLEGKHEKINEPMWFKHGGKATADAYALVSEEKKLEHIAFLISLQNFHLDIQNRLFVHAGFTNMNGVDYEYFPKLFYWDRSLWETALSLDQSIETTSVFYPKRFTLYQEVYIGHTPITRIGETKPVQKANIWNVDTGAAFKGALTIMDIDSKQVWQSDVLPSLYPKEDGRNI